MAEFTRAHLEALRREYPTRDDGRGMVRPVHKFWGDIHVLIAGVAEAFDRVEELERRIEELEEAAETRRLDDQQAMEREEP